MSLLVSNMAPRFYRGFRAAGHFGDDVSSVAKHLNFISKDFKLPSIPVAHVNFDHALGMLKYGELDTYNLVKHLKRGNFDFSLKQVYPGLDNISEPLALKLKNDIRDLPDYHLGNYERGSTTFKNAVLRDMPGADVAKLSDPKFTDGVTEAMVERNPRLKRVLAYMAGKKFVTFTGVAVVVGLYAAYEAVNQHQRRMAGCYRYAVDKHTGKLDVCKVATCSCEDGKMNAVSGATMCDSNHPIEEIMKNIKNCQENAQSGLYCTHCPVPSDDKKKETEDSGSLTDPDSLSGASEHDRVTYQCMLPSWSDALADIVNSVRETATDAAEEAVKEVGSLLSLIIQISKYIAIVVAVCVAIGGILYTYNKFKSTSESYTVNPERYIQGNEL